MLLIGCNEKVEMIEEEAVVDNNSGDAVLMSDEERIAMEKEKGLEPLDGSKEQVNPDPGKINSDVENDPGQINVDKNSDPEQINVDADPDGPKPWEMNLYLMSSEDGINFDKNDQILVVERGAVPNLILTFDERLIATYQYFSEDDETMFDKISYSVSYDEGATWSGPESINIVNLPEPETNIVPHNSDPIDPALVQLEDGSFRLYFSYAEKGDKYLHPCSARSETMDGDFEYEGPNLELEDDFVLDPSVVYFNGEWHHYTTVHGQIESEDGEVNFHSVSSDGINFERVDDIVLDFKMLGGVVETENNELMFFGSGGKSSKIAISSDGYNWEMVENGRFSGSDPGVAILSDGTYLLLIQSNGGN